MNYSNSTEEAPVFLPSVIIAIQNEALVLEQNLLRFTEQFEDLIVVDNHSIDQSVAICQRFPQVTLISPPPEERWTRGKCWNEGAKHASSPFLLFLHIDSEIPAPALQAWQQCWQSEKVDYSCFQIQFPETEIKYRTLEAISNFRSRYLRIVYGDQGLCIRNTVFQQIGGFPEIPILEDLKINSFLRPYRFQFITSCIFPSSRKFHQIGFFRYLLLMNQVLFLNWLGRDLHQIQKLYSQSPKETK